MVPALGYAVLQRRSDDYCYNDAIAATGAVSAVYRKAVTLNNDGDTIGLSYGETTFDSVTYVASGDDSWPVEEGVSMEFNAILLGTDPHLYNDSPENWCEASSVIVDTTDYGSPGSINDGCGAILTK